VCHPGDSYQEKFFMTPGDTGFQVYDTRYGRVGVAICWDQWFPEPARILALKGAEVRWECSCTCYVLLQD
jgi:N-carbamoylputrescine amidase